MLQMTGGYELLCEEMLGGCKTISKRLLNYMRYWVISLYPAP